MRSRALRGRRVCFSLAETSGSAQLLFTGGDLPLIEQAAAYAVFANLGVVHGVKTDTEQQLSPQLILNVFTPGDELVLLNCTSALESDADRE